MNSTRALSWVTRTCAYRVEVVRRVSTQYLRHSGTFGWSEGGRGALGLCSNAISAVSLIPSPSSDLTIEHVFDKIGGAKFRPAPRLVTGKRMG